MMYEELAPHEALSQGDIIVVDRGILKSAVVRDQIRSHRVYG
jgi:hypothetical protein